MNRLLNWFDDLWYMCSNTVKFENPRYGNQNRTEEFLRCHRE